MRPETKGSSSCPNSVLRGEAAGRVNGVAPGPVMWPEGGVDSDLEAKILDRTLLKRPGSAEDIARAVRFFATEAPYVTGQILAVDGGRSVGW